LHLLAVNDFDSRHDGFNYYFDVLAVFKHHVLAFGINNKVSIFAFDHDKAIVGLDLVSCVFQSLFAIVFLYY
jgi:hypothetical protein